MQIAEMELAGWGGYPRSRSRVACPEKIYELAPPQDEESIIARGLGRSYGDAAMNAGGLVMLTKEMARVISFDEETGALTTQAGATLHEVLREFVPHGWFPSVTPGTKFVTLAGCVAADVHGKNHHRDGTFGAHVKELKLMLADGKLCCLSTETDADLFWATIGGMGLTGLITEVEFQLRPIESAYMIVEHHAARDLEESLHQLESEAWDDDYTVAWIDVMARKKNLGRSILMRGHHAKISELPSRIQRPLDTKQRAALSVPFDFPAWALNSLTASAFNSFYYFWQTRKQGAPFIAHYDSFFYPLDALGHWNRLYGRRGFVQYQCVLPTQSAWRGVKILLKEIAASRRPCFLAVLKRFGPEGRGLLSFPFEGYTLALDLPLGDSSLFEFLNRLDEIVLEHGGRVYLAKDARMSAAAFKKMYARFPEWLSIKKRVDPLNRFQSDLSRRLEMS